MADYKQKNTIEDEVVRHQTSIALSVICPIYNEEKYIRQCIESIVQQDYPKKELEVLLVDGRSTDNTRTIISECIQNYPYIKLLDNPRRTAPCAMNIGIQAARGEIIMRIDAHAHYQRDYFSALTRRLITLDADNVGVVWKTDVLNKTPKTLAIREVLCNKFGVGNALFRTGVSEVRAVDTVPFGCWRRDVFEKYGFYDERLVRNQDIELNKRILNGGGKILIVPDTYCTYWARETFSALSRNNFGNGKWNVLTVYLTRNFKSLSIRHFIPLCFVLGVLLPLCIALVWHPAIWLSTAVLISYFCLMSCISLTLSFSKKLNFFYLIAAFTVLHASYGCGSLVGLLSLPFTKR